MFFSISSDHLTLSSLLLSPIALSSERHRRHDPPVSIEVAPLAPDQVEGPAALGGPAGLAACLPVQGALRLGPAVLAPSRSATTALT